MSSKTLVSYVGGSKICNEPKKNETSTKFTARRGFTNIVENVKRTEQSNFCLKSTNKMIITNPKNCIHFNINFTETEQHIVHRAEVTNAFKTLNLFALLECLYMKSLVG